MRTYSDILVKSILLLIVLFFVVKVVRAELSSKDDWVKGGVIIGTTGQGCVWKPFVKVGDADNNPDTDEPQILGYEPGNVQIAKDGTIIYERVNANLFVPLRGWRIVKGQKCSCPPYNE